ncbi:hypothetical protein PLIIFM63780_005855 [Purpureocillium lilacinum]|uniref:N-acetyltransferase domain-containing protein n=1 Tax=Purpureocillium lilacinum TaxID=33203 RepID=A0ABR0C3P5_PURLI|nr:hypothetical protein Purlil1_4911 [Purpureocillium lilacinum]GJN71808.1 hypothetical protein PLICBS_005877 [Purpureocillium lilacinum]GJN82316.1 hypothetical protein PLIIFM63780_005855 [Purpureocillium lilacinum]
METTPIPKTALKSLSVKTTLPTLPYPPLSSRPVIKTARLLIRPFSATDLDALHALRTQPEVMAWMPLGQIDPDVAKTQAVLEKKLLHDDQNYSYAICLASSGALIGTGGCHSRGGGMLGWPEIGYMLRREAWGMGYGTEFLAGFLEAWWALPRGEAALTVDVSTLDDDGGAVGCDGQVVARECISSFTREDNRASRRVMCKAGMSLVKVWEVIDMRDGKTPIDLYGYVVRRPGPC